MKKKNTNKQIEQSPVGNVTDSGFVKAKDAPIIYAYIYERESEDVERFWKNYENIKIEKEQGNFDSFSIVDGKVVPNIAGE